MKFMDNKTELEKVKAEIECKQEEKNMKRNYLSLKIRKRN